METRSNVITVTETASEKITADTVRLNVAAVGESKKYAEAASNADEAAGSVVSALGAVGVQLRALGTSVSAVHTQDGKISGYRAVRSMSAEFAYDGGKLAAVYAALENGKCEWRVSFALKDESAAEALIARAVQSAHRAAQTIARAAGVRLGELARAEFSAGDTASPVMFMRAAAGAAEPEPELITVSQTVTCSWEIKNA
ncbi:MAG: SIMPL domain-containing protein [Roseburia sp.]|nr:SIMPL domain-containing protein [Roseburia sp.]